MLCYASGRVLSNDLIENFTTFFSIPYSAHIWLIILCEIGKVKKHENAMYQNLSPPQADRAIIRPTLKSLNKMTEKHSVLSVSLSSPVPRAWPHTNTIIIMWKIKSVQKLCPFVLQFKFNGFTWILMQFSYQFPSNSSHCYTCLNCLGWQLMK